MAASPISAQKLECRRFGNEDASSASEQPEKVNK
jgi:hypothetical protein